MIFGEVPCSFALPRSNCPMNVLTKRKQIWRGRGVKEYKCKGYFQGSRSYLVESGGGRGGGDK